MTPFDPARALEIADRSDYSDSIELALDASESIKRNMSRAITEIRTTLSISPDSDDINNAVLAFSGSHEGAEDSFIRLEVS